MPKISGYPDGGSLQDTDQLVVNRGGKNYGVVNEVTEVIGAYLENDFVGSGVTLYGAPFKIGVDASPNNIPWPEGGVLHDMVVRKSTNQPATGSLVATLYVNSVATALIVTVPAGAAGASSHVNTTDMVTISADDILRWEFTNNAGTDSCLLTSITMILTKN